MLSKVIKHTSLDKDRCASLLGIDKEIFSEWAAGQRPIPESVQEMLATVFAVTPQALSDTREDEEVPAVWYKLQGSDLQDIDKEYALLTRQVAHFVAEFEEALDKPPVTWRVLFKTIYEETVANRTLSPKEQGKLAAKLFLNQTGLSHGKEGIGELLRGHLRSKGVLIIESPIRGSKLEGFCFMVGRERDRERPCIFANSYRSLWFRRNFVILHELCHGIFDTETQGAAVDFDSEDKKDIPEVRAQAFAMEALVPKEMLKHVVSSLGIKWDALDASRLALLMARTHAEAAVILRAGLEAEYITKTQFDSYAEINVTPELRKISSHALTKEEYEEKRRVEGPAEFNPGDRFTSFYTDRKILLPIGYSRAVIQAVLDKAITSSRAAELMRIDEDEFEKRFGHRFEGLYPAEE